MRPIAANAAFRPFQIRAALRFVLRDLDQRRPDFAAHRLDDRKQLATSADGPSSSTIRIVSAGGKFGCTAASAARIATRVHHLDSRRHDPRRDDLRHGRPGFADAVERGQQRLHGLRLSQDPHDDLRHNRQRAFAADDEPEQIRPRRIGERAADLHELAVRHYRLDGEDVMHGEAVLQAVGAAGILGDVAADRAHLLTRRIRRVVVAERRHLPRDLQVGHARFHGHSLVGNVDLEHAIQPGQADDDAPGNRKRAARQPGSVATRDERHAFALQTRTIACTSAADREAARHRGRLRRCGSASHS